MEGEGDEGTLHHPKRSCKPTNNPNLPQELITAILVRLAVKYLLQYKCVSKDWLSLISSPQFVKTHLSFSAKDYTRHRVLLKEVNYPTLNLKHCSVSSLFNESVTTEAFDLDYPLKTRAKSICIVGSANGLICLRILYEALALWNPSTRKFKLLSDPMLPERKYTPVGFGYDEVHDDYKIVCVFFYNNYDNKDAKVYSLKSDSWTSLDGYPNTFPHPHSYLSKNLNGKIHWLTYVNDIITIDLVDEKFGRIEHPCYAEGEFVLDLGVLGSNFSVLCHYYQGDYYQGHHVTHTDIWVMKEYGVKESWTKLYTIICPDDADVVPMIVCKSNKGESVLLAISNLMVYNPEDKSFRYPGITNLDGCSVAGVYIESLVSPVLQNERMAQH